MTLNLVFQSSKKTQVYIVPVIWHSISMFHFFVYYLWEGRLSQEWVKSKQ